MSARQNFSTACEDALNLQINAELTASYNYLSMYAYLIRDNVALPGLAKYVKEASEEEQEHAHKLIDYVCKRGGRVKFNPIAQPENVDWKSAKNIVEFCLQMEKEVNQSLLNLDKIASDNGDEQMSEFIESEFLGEQVEAIKELCDMLTQLNRVGGDGLGLYLWDQNLKSKK